jgi:DNA-binding CsgD family transcriptional regulator/tetratricopeptide (TPR) repeat protein
MLVGRRGELAAVRERLRRGASLVLIGEAGVGKTTLIDAATQQVGRRRFVGVGLAALSWMPYLPVERALRSSAPEGDSAGVARWLVGGVGRGLLVLDDLHWADRDTLALLPLIAERVTLLAAIRRGDSGAPEAERLATEAGLELLQLDGLPNQDAEELVRLRKPDLSKLEVRRVVRQARGNPFLLEELVRHEQPSTALRLSVGARLERCSEVAQEAMGLLSLLGRPAEPALIEAGIDELVQAGLVVAEPEVTPRHALLGEVAAERLGDDTRRRLHSKLARLLGDPGEAARHHKDAGERELAFSKALEAARRSHRPGERARHLGIAAECAVGPGANKLRLDAAAALVDAGELEAVERLAAAVDEPDPAVLAEVALCRARARSGSGDHAGADDEVAAGLSLVAGSGSPVEARLLVESVWSRTVEGRLDAAIRLGRDAVRVCGVAGIEKARALCALGLAHLLSSEERQARECFDDALREAREIGDPALECEAVAKLVNLLNWTGEAVRCRALSRETARRAESLGLRRWQLELEYLDARAAFYSFGDYEHAIAALRQLAAEPALGIHSDEVRADLAAALADVGRDREARALLRRARPEAHSPGSRFLLCAAQIHVEWLSGRSARVLRLWHEFEELDPPTIFALEVATTVGWAAIELERDPVVGAVEAPPILLGRQIANELGALECLADPKRLDEAEERFAAAAAAWSGTMLRNELRCLWGAGEAARLNGFEARARDRFLEVERRSSELGLLPLAVRARRSLRQVGVAVAPARSRGDGTLTPREKEVLTLVAEGLTSTEIARRLGVARSTVETQVASAKAKLGAQTRLHAAALSAGRS